MPCSPSWEVPDHIRTLSSRQVWKRWRLAPPAYELCVQRLRWYQQRRLRSWLRHERQTVAMELAAALHHSRDVGPGTHAGLRAQKAAGSGEVEAHETHSALRGPKQPPSRERPGLPPEPRPQRSDRTMRRSSGDNLPTLALPVLAGSAGEVVDSSSLRFLTASALKARREEEEEKEKEKEAAKRKEVQTEVQQQAAEALEQARLLLERSKRKRKKRRKRKLPKTSSLRRPCAHAARVPAVLRRVSTGPRCSASWSVWTRWTAPRSSSFLAVARARLVSLVLLLAVFPFVVGRPVLLGFMPVYDTTGFLFRQCRRWCSSWTSFSRPSLCNDRCRSWSGHCAALGLDCWHARVGPHGPYSAEARGASTGAVLGRGYCRYDRTVIFLLALCFFVLSGPRCSASWPVRTRRTVARGVQETWTIWENLVVTCSMLLPEKCVRRFSWETTSGMVSVFSAIWTNSGCMFLSVFPFCRQAQMLGILAGVDQKDSYAVGWFLLVTMHLALFSFVVLRPLMLDIMAGLDQTDNFLRGLVAFPQVQLLDEVVVPVVCTTNASFQLLFTVEALLVQLIIKVIYIPVAAQRQVSMVLLFSRPSRFHGCSSSTRSSHAGALAGPDCAVSVGFRS